MLEFETNLQQAENELLNEVKLFFYDLDSDVKIKHFTTLEGNNSFNEVVINDKKYTYNDVIAFCNEVEKTRYYHRSCKKAVYTSLKDFTGKFIPWGSLTGIRPTKIAYEFLNNGGSEGNIARYLMREYDVSPVKATLISDIVHNQKQSMIFNEKAYNLYVHIPFCTSKCSYCSFITFDSKAWKKSISTYCDCLVKEIEDSYIFRNENGYNLFSTYIGGGTPTALDEENFEKVLSVVQHEGKEFTCEAGRPDTIAEKKLDIMKKYGVTRVCVNPQSFNNKTLALIGRNHSVEEFYEKYELVKSYGFDVNIDLIAGLPDESIDDFKNSIDRAIELMPSNLTVHTLSRKNGSTLKNSGKYDNFDVEKMIEYSSSTLPKYGYLPYYLYRQKSMLGNLENTGYCLKGKQCVNNITTMEEVISVDANGAGAISKRIIDNGRRIERLANLRDVKLYIEQFEERLEKKNVFNLTDFSK